MRSLISRVIIFVAIAWLLNGSVAAQREKSALMQADVASYMHPPDHDMVKAPTWEPTKEQIEMMETSFDKLAVLKPDRDCCRTANFIFEPDAYYMQYAAIFLDGHPYIYINAFRDLPDGWGDGWRKEWRMVKGGGHNFWQALYDPSTQKFSKLRFNADE